MPQALSAVYVHLVFSTKARRPWLRDKPTRDALHAFLGAASREFEWQGGYAIFSVSPSNIDAVKEYIARQEEHHRKMPFQDELRALLRKYQLEWDERYLWD